MHRVLRIEEADLAFNFVGFMCGSRQDAYGRFYPAQSIRDCKADTGALEPAPMDVFVTGCRQRQRENRAGCILISCGHAAIATKPGSTIAQALRKARIIT